MKKEASLFNRHKAIIISVLILCMPSTSLACGSCADHSLDWIAPFILPMLPVAVIYLLTKRILYWAKCLPESVPSPKFVNFIASFVTVVILLYTSMGSLWVAMLFMLVVALQDYIRSWINEWRKSRSPLNIKSSKVFHGVFLVLWIASAVGTIYWTNSSSRMMFHLRNGSPIYHLIRESYATRAERYKETIKEELEAACDGTKGIKPFQLSGIFFLSSKLKDSSIAPCIAKLLMNNVGKKDLYYDLFLEEGLYSLSVLDRVLLINTCKILLNEKQFSGKTVKNIGYEFGKRMSFILAMLIENGQRQEYENFITIDNIEILLKYRSARYRKRRGSHILEGEKNIGLRGLDLDLESFGIDPAILGK